jgi:predicted dehydrogenase
MAGAVKVGLVGVGFIGDIHAYSIKQFVPQAEVVTVASATPGRAERFARERAIPRAFADYRQLLAMDEVELVLIAVPNDLHARIAIDAARAGKHVICEKPLCRTLGEADQMMAACREAGVQLFYAEELLFAPKYVRAKTLVDEGALGEVFLADVRRGLELRLPAGDPALRPLRPRRGAADRDRRGRARGAQDHARGLPVGWRGPQGYVAVRAAPGREADRPLEATPGGTGVILDWRAE